MKNITIRSLRAKQKGDLETANNFFEKSRNETEEMEDKKRSGSYFRKLVNFIVLVVFVLAVGGIGGVLTDRFAIPYLLVNYPQLNQYEFLKRVNERTTVVEITKEIKISEDEAVMEAIKNTLPAIVQIVEPEKDADGKLNGEFIHRGTGVILTSDGVIITSLKNITITNEEEETEKEIKTDAESDTVVKKNLARIKLNNGKIYSAELIAEDISTGFAIVKIAENNLPVLAFAAFENIRLGEKIIALDDAVAVDIVSKFIGNDKATENNEKGAGKKRIGIMNSLEESFNGAPVINLKNEIIGISQGGKTVVAMDEIMIFVNSVYKR
ncbi:MAG: trypsin-like peptidase domain-containing protein [Patescibacteria group bacterium]|nr:trypsin-like peptidase domain-containing protein [Patescibacteria group bacterium]